MNEDKCTVCITNKKECLKCMDNPIYKNIPTVSLYTEYKSLCPWGFDDCGDDPIYIYNSNIKLYKTLYGALTPLEASQIHCHRTNNKCYKERINK